MPPCEVEPHVPRAAGASLRSAPCACAVSRPVSRAGYIRWECATCSCGCGDWCVSALSKSEKAVAHRYLSSTFCQNVLLFAHGLQVREVGDVLLVLAQILLRAGPSSILSSITFSFSPLLPVCSEGPDVLVYRYVATVYMRRIGTYICIVRSSSAPSQVTRLETVNVGSSGRARGTSK